MHYFEYYIGYVYSALDPNCPLKEIYCVATPYNIWANIQPEARPFMMQFNVLDTSQWRPFFGNRLPSLMKFIYEQIFFTSGHIN